MRLSEYPPGVLVSLSLLAVICGYLKDELQPLLGTDAANWFARSAFAVSFVSLIPVFVRDVNLWRFFPPAYQGLDELYGKLGDEATFKDTLFVGTDGRLRVDTFRLLTTAEPLMGRLKFVGTDDRLNHVAAKVNAEAFERSRYGTSLADKLKRNSAIAARHGATFALVADPVDANSFIGLSSVIPLSPPSAYSYLAGNISDNAFNAEMVAIPGDEIGCIVAFLIASAETKSERKALAAEGLEALLLASMVQMTLIAIAAGGAERHQVVAANSSKKMRKLFGRLNLIERRDFKSADQEDVFANYVYFRNQQAARAYLRTQHPGLAAQLGLATPAA